jgi:hypothetical protein
MEVISKELHKQMLPIVLVIVGLFAGIAMLTTPTGVVLARGLVTQVLHVEQGKNGLAHISTEQQKTSLGQVGQTAGSISNLSITLESSARASE